ncbi:MAG: DUF2231 domain-containing protein [Rhodothermales bacterium]|nr:DUF2231 domain-containing protein [Rhodothermales bacterium]
MESLFQYEIPYLHPLAVHFPLVLLLTAAGTATVWAVRGAAFWRRCTLLLTGLGMAGGLAAYWTGDDLYEGMEGTPIVEELVGLHEDLALYTLIVAALGLVTLAGLSVWLERRTTLERDPPDPLWARLVVAVLALAAGVLVALTAHAGSTMVWGVAP